MPPYSYSCHPILVIPLPSLLHKVGSHNCHFDYTGCLYLLREQTLHSWILLVQIRRVFRLIWMSKLGIFLFEKQNQSSQIGSEMVLLSSRIESLGCGFDYRLGWIYFWNVWLFLFLSSFSLLFRAILWSSLLKSAYQSRKKPSSKIIYQTWKKSMWLKFISSFQKWCECAIFTKLVDSKSRPLQNPHTNRMKCLDFQFGTPFQYK